MLFIPGVYKLEVSLALSKTCIPVISEFKGVVCVSQDTSDFFPFFPQRLCLTPETISGSMNSSERNWRNRLVISSNPAGYREGKYLWSTNLVPISIYSDRRVCDFMCWWDCKQSNLKSRNFQRLKCCESETEKTTEKFGNHWSSIE